MGSPFKCGSLSQMYQKLVNRHTEKQGNTSNTSFGDIIN
jgi:hypothetical protein